MKETPFKSDTAIDMVISQHTQPTRRPLKQPAPSISRPSRRTQAPQAADAHTVAEAVHDTSTFLEACPAAPATPFKVAVEGVAPVPDTPLQAPATTSCAKQGTAGIEPNAKAASLGYSERLAAPDARCGLVAEVLAERITGAYNSAIVAAAGRGGEDVLSEARLLREQAEELCRSREANAATLQKQMADLRRRSRDELLRLEKRNLELAAENKSLSSDLAAKSKSAQREGDVARQWQAAWTSESAAREVKERALKDTETSLTAVRHELEQETAQRQLLEARLETAVLQALKHRQELEGERDEAAAGQQRAEQLLADATAELAVLRPRTAQARTEHEVLGAENVRLKASNEELARSRAEALERVSALAQQLQDEKARGGAQLADMTRQRDEVLEINAQLCGHRNAKQKIQYLLKVKAEKEEAKKESLRLAAIVKKLGGTAALLHSQPAVDMHAIDVAVGQTEETRDTAMADSTMASVLSAAATESDEAPATPGPCVLDTTMISPPQARGGPMQAAGTGGAAEARGATVKLTQPKSPRLMTSRRGQGRGAVACQMAAPL